ncbi:MAG: hydrogenase maturation protease [Chloroflexi bacterium]|nr:hydrogenase maturation protease [Chloroflexota bacterium]
MKSSVLVLGLGNPLRGDDGVGPRIIEELTRRGLPEGVTAQDVGNAGLDLLNILEGWERTVIVDAAEMGREPGQFVRFTPNEARLTRAGDHLSLHNAGLSDVLALADALGRTLPDLVIFGVQPAEIDWRAGLSPAVEAAIPALTDAIIAELS